MKTLKVLALGLFAGLLALTVVTLSTPLSAEATADVAVLSTLQASDELTSDEIDGLVFMVEEEKLARDVYLTLYEPWDLRIFQNIHIKQDGAASWSS